MADSVQQDLIENIEGINGELFEVFNPDEELWVIGGSGLCGSGSKGGGDGDITF